MALANITKIAADAGSFADVTSSALARLQGSSLYGKPINWEDDDDFQINENQTVTFSCGNKKVSVTGYMSEPVILNGASKWGDINNNMFTGLAFKLIDTFDENQQIGIGASVGNAGVSYNQPWASRKFWKGSEPFNLTIKFNLIAISNAKEDVYDQAIKLLSLCYPRDLGADDNAAKNLIDKIGIFDTNGTDTNTAGGPNVVTAFSNAFKSWAVPGPSIYWSSSESDEKKTGDNVKVVIGSLFAFAQCYVTNVNLEFSPTLDSTGYPLWCKCSVTFQSAESNYVTSDGKFSMNKWGDSASTLGTLMSSIGTTVSEFVNDMIDHVKALFNAVLH